MDKAQQFQRLKQSFRGKILLDEPLSDHTSFRIGGPADYYVYPKDLEDLGSLVDFCHREELSRFVIGAGTNLLVSDDGFRGVVIDLTRTFTQIGCKGYLVTAGSGVFLRDLIKYCQIRGLAGIENLVGIPGCVGGGIRLNAGAWGMEIGDSLQSVRLLDKDGALEKRNREEMTLGYRQTDFDEAEIVVEADFLLREGNPSEIDSRQTAFLKERREKQPLSLPSAGSVFKRPPGDYAGRLIEESGCRGMRIGDAMVSKKHANFIVNCKLASARDVLRLIREVQERVYRQFEVELELEIHLVGFGKS